MVVMHERHAAHCAADRTSPAAHRGLHGAGNGLRAVHGVQMCGEAGR